MMPRDPALREARAVALRDMIGAAAAVCCHLAALRSDAELGEAMADDAAAWLSEKLANAAEHLRALHDGSAPRWRTLADADTLRDGLAAIGSADGFGDAAGAIYRGLAGACAEPKAEG